MTNTLLVIDDEPSVLYSLKKALASESLEVLTAATAREGLELVRSRSPDAVLIDVKLPDMSGIEAFKELREIDSRMPVIVMTAFSSAETAIEAMRCGALEYLLKPVDLTQLLDTVRRALELSRMRRVPVVLKPSSDSAADRIVGNSHAMQELYKAIGRVAPQNVTVLILGESGTGKELIARAIFQYSQRASEPFLAINCAAIPDTLLESELFGHERGAFTGADRRRIGKFEQANGGTLFLDEVGDMSPATQVKLLRVLQDQTFQRVGGSETVTTSVRLIAATNRDLAAMVADGGFRQDLYYRLNVFTIRVPPLRHRKEDLPELIEYFLKRFSRQLGKPIPTISPDAMQCLQDYNWPGNVRELESAIKFAIVHSTSDVLLIDNLPEPLLKHCNAAAEVELAPGTEPSAAMVTRQLLEAGEHEIYAKVLQTIDRQILTETLEFTRGNQVQASELLGISRTTLRAKLRSLGMSLSKQIDSDQDG